MKKIAVILLLLISIQGFTQKIPYDKQLHLIAGATISAGTYAVVHYNTGNKTTATLASIGVTAFAGLSKELYDQYSYGGFDWRDFEATMAGSIPVIITLNLTIPDRYIKTGYTGKKAKRFRPLKFIDRLFE